MDKSLFSSLYFLASCHLVYLDDALSMYFANQGKVHTLEYSIGTQPCHKIVLISTDQPLLCIVWTQALAKFIILK